LVLALSESSARILRRWLLPIRVVTTQYGTAIGNRFYPRDFKPLQGGDEMTWTKLSDDFADDCWTLSDAAHRLHIEGLTWSNRKLLDLRIPKEDVRRFKRPEALPELLDIGYWLEGQDYFEIVHHGRYQRLRVDVIKQQQANSANALKKGKPKPPPREIQALGFPSIAKDSLNESLTEMDRTGRDRTGLKLEVEEQVQLVNDWPVAAIPIGTLLSEPLGPNCQICSLPLHSALASEGTHPNCDSSIESKELF
jgi:hypothetical protein